MNIENVHILIAVVLTSAIVLAFRKFRRAFIVPEGYAGLLYHNGKFAEVLAPGRHVRWGRNFTLNAQDTRKTTLSVPSQEILTADNVSLKFNLAVTHQMTDPSKAAHEAQNWQAELYNSAQLALRTVVSGLAVDALLTQRTAIGAQLVASMQPEGAKVGINVLAVEVKDVIFPADLKRAFAETLKARQEGQAALERARGETAALRNLANAARMLEGNPALINLRLMQSLSAAQHGGNTLVLGVPGFLPLKDGKAGSPEHKPEDGAS
jgi:regulator of protease activity HflC (stomatin/prohibitin superfamily)